ncbi:amino acid ABC transporter ATP-binding/permease protein [Roseomonas xinghualingensis]|uniref:amino acid ABC transporter ATP-binding/permease protein n=1 Tax=Roseomonas xinghualingensis TaxID=2986475 RepID=UPI0021F147F1|nr:ATP-binding cassette domain-containing protein [Roseomonas sp. SXEYE001]MCV4208530.1 ATP-binding cassette domain-containing protein [Roseomonas sp. SXEYE001]
MSSPGRLQQLLAAERARQRGRFIIAGLAAATVSAASVLLLGLSGWFITGAALAGAAGSASAHAFNYMLPSAGIRLLAILRTGSRYGERLVGHDAALRALARIRPALFSSLAAAPPARSMSLSTGEASARLVQDVDAVEAHFVRLSANWGMVASIASGTALLLLAGIAPALAAAGIALGFLLLAHLLANALQARGRAAQRAAGRLKEDFATYAAAASELRAYGLEGWAAGRIDERSQELASAQSRVTAGAGWFELGQAVATGLAAVAALGLSYGGPLPMAALAALGAAMTVDGVSSFARGLERRGTLREAEARLESMLDAEIPPRPSRPLMDAAPAIRLSRQDALLRPGEVVAVTGPSGCGKTTLLETLLALREVEPGRISLGGADLAMLPPDVARRCFAHAPQDAALLAGTVRDNLRLAAPDASDGELWEALRDAALADRVAALSGGLDAWLGENGARLSGGERRRLVLTRAYLRPAPWLLLDEPTEGLDAATEARVLDALQVRLERTGQGALIVTHRPGPLALCGRVVALGGREVAGPALVPMIG